MPDNTDIIQIPAMDYRSLLGKESKGKAFSEKVKQNVVAQLGVKLLNTFPFSLVIGEGGLMYMRNLVRFGQKMIDEKKITHIYSSYRPFTDHYAAYLLKKRNPHITWIADFRDLIIDPHYRHLFLEKQHQEFFQKIFSRANLLTTVSEGLAKHLHEYNSHVLTVRNGLKVIEDPKAVFSDRFNIVFTGSMFLDKRNPRPLFQALHELANEGSIVIKDIRLVNAGKDPEQWKELAKEFKLEKILEIKGVVPPEEAERLQQVACINVLLTISSDELQGVLTGKMIEYFKAGSPILSIVVNQNDPELDSLLTELEIGKSFSDNEQNIPAIKEFILREYKYWRYAGVNRKPVKMSVLREKYAEDVVMDELKNFIFPPTPGGGDGSHFKI